MCSACWQRNADRPVVRAHAIAANLSDPPPWLQQFTSYLAARHCPARAATMISNLGRLLTGDQSQHPQAVLEHSRRPGRSMGSLARALEGFFTEYHLALPTDQTDRLAAGRRRRRIDAVPAPLRRPVQTFADSLLTQRERARRARTRPRSNHTIEHALAIVRDVALFLDTRRGKLDWALVDVHDIEAFLAASPKNRKSRLTVLRRFFGFARTQKLILTDPTRELEAKAAKGFTGRTLPISEQRTLFRRWTTDPDMHPHEALLGILALLHGASSQEVRLLQHQDIDTTNHTLQLGHRPRPVELDPSSWTAVQRCLDHRAQQHTDNPHLVVTRGTKAGRTPASVAYFCHLLDPCAVAPKTLRSTRLVDLVNTIDPKLTAAAFGMSAQATISYLADRIDPTRLPDHTPNL